MNWPVLHWICSTGLALYFTHFAFRQHVDHDLCAELEACNIGLAVGDDGQIIAAFLDLPERWICAILLSRGLRHWRIWWSRGEWKSYEFCWNCRNARPAALWWWFHLWAAGRDETAIADSFDISLRAHNTDTTMSRYRFYAVPALFCFIWIHPKEKTGQATWLEKQENNRERSRSCKTGRADKETSGQAAWLEEQ